MTEAPLVYPRWLDVLGMTASSIAFIIAIYLQIYLDQKVRVRHVFGFIGIGFALFLLSIRAEFLSNNTMVKLRAGGYLVLIALELWGVREVLKDLGMVE